MGVKGFFIPPSQRQYHNGPPPEHYQQPPPHNGYGGHNDYAPPQGPPPNYYQGHNGYGPPQNGNYGGGHPGYAPPPPQQPPRPGYGGPPPSHGYGGPPPSQGYGGPQYHHKTGPAPAHRPQNGGVTAGGDGAWVPPRVGCTRLTRTSWLWTKNDTFCELGPVCKGEPYYSCKFGASVRTKLKPGSYDQDGPLIGEVASKGFLSSKYLPTFNGFETELRTKGYSLSGSVSVWAFDVPINGRTETFEWKPHDKSMSARLNDLKGWELKRKGAPEQSPPLVVYKDVEANGFSSKSKLGTVEFLGEATTGQLGDFFPNLVILTLLNIKHQKFIEKVAGAAG